jgi:hypothetical protein
MTVFNVTKTLYNTELYEPLPSTLAGGDKEDRGQRLKSTVNLLFTRPFVFRLDLYRKNMINKFVELILASRKRLSHILESIVPIYRNTCLYTVF